MLPTYLSTPVVVIRRTLDSPYSEIRENFVKRFNTDTDLAQRVITGQMHKKVICNNLHKKDLAEIIAQTTLPRQISTRYIRCIANLGNSDYMSTTNYLGKADLAQAM